MALLTRRLDEACGNRLGFGLREADLRVKEVGDVRVIPLVAGVYSDSPLRVEERD